MRARCTKLKLKTTVLRWVRPFWNADRINNNFGRNGSFFNVAGYLIGLGEYYSRCKNLALYIRDCESLCLSDETVKAVGPFYLVSMPGEVKYPTQGVNV